MSVLTLVLVPLVVYVTVVPAVRALRGRRRFGLGDRAGVVDEIATALFGTAVARLFLPWGELPAALWALPVAATVATALGGALVWRDLPTFAGPRWHRTASVGVSVVLALAALAALLVGLAR